MKRQDKDNIIQDLTEELKNWDHIYLADTGELNAQATSDLRRKCFDNNIKLIFVKNTLLRKAFASFEDKYNDVLPATKGYSSILLSNTGNAPAKLIKEFRKKNKKPILKAAFVEECTYLGDEMLDKLVTIKSKNELVADLVFLLQSPVRNVISSLESGKHIIAGVVKTLSEK